MSQHTILETTAKPPGSHISDLVAMYVYVKFIFGGPLLTSPFPGLGLRIYPVVRSVQSTQIPAAD